MTYLNHEGSLLEKSGVAIKTGGDTASEYSHTSTYSLVIYLLRLVLCVTYLLSFYRIGAFPLYHYVKEQVCQLQPRYLEVLEDAALRAEAPVMGRDPP